MTFGPIFSYDNRKEAEDLIGSRVIACEDYDTIANIENLDVTKAGYFIGDLLSIEDEPRSPFIIDTGWGLTPYIRPVYHKSMTHRELAEWCARGFGEWKHYPSSSDNVYTTYNYLDHEANYELTSSYDGRRIVIRPWGSNIWTLPTSDIYWKHCRNGWA